MSARVFVLENDKWLGDQYEKSLKQDGFTVQRTADPYEAIELIDDTMPDVIVMGILLGGGGSIGLLHELQSYIDTAKIPVIVCTSISALTLEDLEPYGVKRLLHTSLMKPQDVSRAVRSVLA